MDGCLRNHEREQLLSLYKLVMHPNPNGALTKVTTMHPTPFNVSKGVLIHVKKLTGTPSWESMGWMLKTP